MTEKRFYTDGQYVMQDGEVYVICNGEHNADVVATALNELIEERNKLQFDYNMEILTRQSIEKENEQLKSHYNKISEWDFDEIIKVLEAQQETEKENQELKDFIKKLADDTGRIVLMNGYGYHISKVINDD